MKKSILLILLISSLATCLSQSYTPFLQSGNYWEEFSEIDPIQVIYGGARIIIKGDSILNGEQYSKCYQVVLQTDPDIYDSTQNKTFLALFREDISNKKVYYFSPFTQTDSLFYDFSLEVGDTSQFQQIVSEIDSVQLNNGEYRKRWFFLPSDNIWVEGIGGLTRFLAPNFGQGFMTDVMCYGNNNIPLYGVRCADLLSSSEKEVFEKNIEISPNPTTDILSLKIPLNIKVQRVQLYDLVRSKMEIRYMRDALSIAHLSSGIYFLTIEGDGYKVTKKIIKI